ncbi:MAG: class I SAM-dependent methyltransferase [Patescibacteria group bacterium]
MREKFKQQKVGKFYDLVWGKYIPEEEEHRKHLEIFFKDEEINKKKILDAGCGTGIFSVIFAKKGAEKVFGIDISEESLNTAKSLARKFNLNNIEFKVDDMLNLQFPDKYFDIVWAWGSAHHTTNPLKAIDELIRALADRGVLFIALYKKTNLTWLHELIRRICILAPRFCWVPLSKIMAVFLWPVTKIFKREESKRRGEKLEELILDWYFVPVRHYFNPDFIKNYLENKGFFIEKYLPLCGRFESTTNFIFKARKK